MLREKGRDTEREGGKERQEGIKTGRERARKREIKGETSKRYRVI
jgi:hypothetical protein